MTPGTRTGSILVLACVLLLAGLAAFVIQRRTERLRRARELQRLLEESGHVENKVRWRRSRHARLARLSRLLELAARRGLALQRSREQVELAPPSRSPRTGTGP